MFGAVVPPLASGQIFWTWLSASGMRIRTHGVACAFWIDGSSANRGEKFFRNPLRAPAALIDLKCSICMHITPLVLDIRINDLELGLNSRLPLLCKNVSSCIFC